VKNSAGAVVWDTTRTTSSRGRPRTANARSVAQSNSCAGRAVQGDDRIFQVRGRPFEHERSWRAITGIVCHRPLILRGDGRRRAEVVRDFTWPTGGHGLIYTHPHVDQLRRCRGVLPDGPAMSRPRARGFMSIAVSENVYAGPP